MFPLFRLAFWLSWTSSLCRVSAETEPPLRILASLPAIYSWAAQVGGDRVQVESLLPPGAEPHDYQFRPRDIDRLKHADLILLNGVGFEAWLSPILEHHIPHFPGKILELAAGIPRTDLIFDSPSIGELKSGSTPTPSTALPNPHLWLDPVFAQGAVSNILAAFQNLRPQSSTYFSTNAARYLIRLRQLDSDFCEITKSVSDPCVVTFHDAFPYFCRRYHLKVIGVLEESPGIEPAPRQISQLLAKMRTHRTPVIFAEPRSNARLAHRLAEDLHIEVAELDTLESSECSPNGYEEGMRRNLLSLTRYLR